MVFNVTFNTISVKSWRKVLLVEEKGDHEKTTDLSQVTDKLYHVLSSTHTFNCLMPLLLLLYMCVLEASDRLRCIVYIELTLKKTFDLELGMKGNLTDI